MNFSVCSAKSGKTPQSQQGKGVGERRAARISRSIAKKGAGNAFFFALSNYFAKRLLGMVLMPQAPPPLVGSTEEGKGPTQPREVQGYNVEIIGNISSGFRFWQGLLCKLVSM